MDKILKIICIIFLVFLSGCSSRLQKHTAPDEYSLADPLEQDVQTPRRYPKEIPEAVEYYTIGYLYEIRGSQNLAYESYKLALQYDSLSKEIPIALARTSRNDSLKIIWYKKVLEFDSMNIRALSEIGDYYFLKNDYSTALSYYDKLINNISKNEHFYVSTLYKLGFIYEERGQFSKAIDYYNRIVDVNPNFPLIRRKIIMFLSLQQRFDMLDSLFDVWIKEGANLHEVYKDKGLVNEARGEYDVALEDYRQSLKKAGNSKDSLEVLTAIASIYSAKDDLDEASLIYLEILDLDSSKTGTLNNLGYYYINEENFDMAQIFLDKSLSIDSTQIFANFYKGILMSKQDKHDSAIVYFAKTNEYEKGYLPALTFMGFSYMKLENYSKADSIFMYTIQRDSNYIESYYYYGISLRRQKRLEDAKDILKKALKLDNKDKYILFDLGSIYERLGNIDTSITYFEKVIEMDSENALALNYLGYMLIDLDIDIERGGKLVSKALEIEPDNGAIIDSYGWYYYKKGEYEKALKYIEKAFEILGDDAEVLEHLGDIHYQLGNKDKSLQYYNDALKNVDDELNLENRIIEKLEKSF